MELAAVLDAGLPIVMRCGNAATASVGGGLAFVADESALNNLQHLVDVTAAEAGMPADLTRILTEEVAARPGGAAVSAEIAGSVGRDGDFTLSISPYRGAADLGGDGDFGQNPAGERHSEEAAAAVQAAGRGTPGRLVALPPPARRTAGCGILPALAILLAAGSDFGYSGPAILRPREQGEQGEQGEQQYGRSVPAALHDARDDLFQTTALMKAAAAGQAAAVEALLAAGAALCH